MSRGEATDIELLSNAILTHWQYQQYNFENLIEQNNFANEYIY
jgi:hypothetical protein